MKNLTLLLLVVLSFFSCYSPCPNCGCDSVDDCLSKYKFEEARKYDSESVPQNLPKIIISEISYWVSQKNFDQAYKILAQDVDKLDESDKNRIIKKIIDAKIENSHLSNFMEILKLLSYYKEFEEFKPIPEINKTYFECYIESIKFFSRQNKNEICKELESMLPEKIIIESKNHDITGRGGQNPELDCKILYFEIKNILSKNQEIESFRGCGFNYYIFTYEYPKKEAKKIIEEYKREK